MAHERNPDSPDRFTTAVLPWLIGASGLLVYLVTLNWWVSFQSLDLINEVLGQVWPPALVHPLTWAVLTCFKFLPQAFTPLALNLFSAVCGALVLALVARTVALFQSNDAGEARERSRSGMAAVPAGWIPPVLAAGACGLQLTFWEHATAVSDEMINLLLFAYITRNLFEFRADGNERWLGYAAFAYGAGIANDWGFMGFLPIFLAALIWFKQVEFFNGWFLLRLGGSALAGTSLYLLLPLVNRFWSATPTGFWEALKTNWQYETESLLGFPEWTLFLLTLMILLPVFVIAISPRQEKKDEGGDNELAVFLGKGSFRAAHAMFLGLSVWVALDLPFSPRKIGAGLPLLPYYYLNALVMGYCGGYLLRAGLGHFHSDDFFLMGTKLIAKVGAYWVCVLAVALPLELVWRNYSELRWTNGPALRRFAEQLYDGLPPGKSVALSDSAEQTILLQAALSAHGHDKDALVVDLAALPARRYQLAMARRYGGRWPVAPAANGPEVIGREELLDLVTQFGAREQLVCLNPGFGYYQELYVDESRGLAHHLLPRLPGDLSLDHLDAAAAAANESYWQDQWEGAVRALAERASLEAASKHDGGLIARTFLAREENRTAGGLRNAYARALDDWGAQLQRLGQWREAAVWFQRALSLRFVNLAPRINQLYNERQQRGETNRLDMHEVESKFHDAFANYPTWERVVMESGPVDEPTFLNETARVLLYEGNVHEAAEDYARCLELAPDWTECKLWFAQSLVGCGNFERALAVVESVRPERDSLDQSQLAQRWFCRTLALQGLGRTKEADACISQFAREHGQQKDVLAMAVNLARQERHFELALDLLDQLLAREPGNAQWLSDKGTMQMELGRNDGSIASLTAALALAPTNGLIRLNRAVALLKAGQLDASRQDYEVLLKDAPNSEPILFGLEEIAWRQQKRDTAIGFCQQYLTNSSPQSAEYKLVANHLRTLQSSAKASD